MRQLIVTLICLLPTAIANANVHFEVDGIHYWHYWVESYSDNAVSVGNSESCWEEYNIDLMNCTPWCAIGGIYSGTVTIPSTVIYNGVEYVVNRIAPAAFVHCTDLIEVKIPSTIETIGIGAFYDCPKLKTIDFSPNTRGVRSIYFYGCNSLEKLDLSIISDFV